MDIAARLHLLASLAALSLAGCATLPAGRPVARYDNGLWWNGTGFARRTVWVVGDRLAFRRPGGAGRRVDLGGAFVTPPFADGHNHWLEPARVAAYNACYLADGVFYVRDMGNMPYLADRIRPQLNRDDTVDFTSAMMGFTGPGGHPVEILDQFVAFRILPADWRTDYDGKGIFIVTDQASIDRDLDLLAAQRPAIVKTFLLFSERYSQSLADPATRGNSRGIDPKLMPGLVRSAHARGLRVAAHVYSAADFRTAVAAGVDEIAHLPGTGFRRGIAPADFQITDSDARAAARAGVKVTTTLYWLDELIQEDPDQGRIARDEVAIPNLRRLKAAGVPILIGSDEFRHDSRDELKALQRLGVFTADELLAMNQSTVRNAFPKNAVGALADGYRADFIASRRDPRIDLGDASGLFLRVKSGRRLDLPAAAVRRPSSACVEGNP
jgi:imidazolonepropionase-like amidohydrolase